MYLAKCTLTICHLDCLGNSFDLEMLVGIWFQCTMEVSLIIVMKRLAPESQMIEETDSLGISGHSFEGGHAGSLERRRHGWHGDVVLAFSRLKRTCSWVQGRGLIRPVGAFGDLSWLETSLVCLLRRDCVEG